MSDCPKSLYIDHKHSHCPSVLSSVPESNRSKNVEPGAEGVQSDNSNTPNRAGRA